jgi:hypothetical protein
MLISTALLLDSNSVCTPAKLPCRRVEVGYEHFLSLSISDRFKSGGKCNKNGQLNLPLVFISKISSKNLQSYEHFPTDYNTIRNVVKGLLRK